MTKQPPTKSLRTVLLEKAFYIVFDAPIQLSYRHIFRQLLFFFSEQSQSRTAAMQSWAFFLNVFEQISCYLFNFLICLLFNLTIIKHHYFLYLFMK